MFRKVMLSMFIIASHTWFCGANNEEVSLTQDTTNLRKYFNAIKEIRTILDAAAAPFNYQTGFVKWPKPNPYFKRTTENLFLEIYTVCDEIYVQSLYTPFGMVNLLIDGDSYEIQSISKKFFHNEKLKLQDVTNITDGYKKPYDSSQLYLITSVGDINLCKKATNTTRLKVFRAVTLTPEQYKKDEEQFSVLSKRLNRF